MKLKVPYISQWGCGANESRDDCGPACLAMVLSSYGILETVDDVFRATGAAPDQLITFKQLIKSAKSFGLDLTSKTLTLETLKTYLANGYPIICLVNYRYMSGRQDKYDGPHFITAIGKTAHRVIFHDPNRLRGNSYGDSKEATDASFKKMWGTPNEGNRAYQTLVPVKPIGNSNGEGVEEVSDEKELKRLDTNQDEIKKTLKEHRKLIDDTSGRLTSHQISNDQEFTELKNSLKTQSNEPEHTHIKFGPKPTGETVKDAGRLAVFALASALITKIAKFLGVELTPEEVTGVIATIGGALYFVDREIHHRTGKGLVPF